VWLSGSRRRISSSSMWNISRRFSSFPKTLCIRSCLAARVVFKGLLCPGCTRIRLLEGFWIWFQRCIWSGERSLGMPWMGWPNLCKPLVFMFYSSFWLEKWYFGVDFF
jgi:hypothetical protein